MSSYFYNEFNVRREFVTCITICISLFSCTINAQSNKFQPENQLYTNLDPEAATYSIGLEVSTVAWQPRLTAISESSTNTKFSYSLAERQWSIPPVLSLKANRSYVGTIPNGFSSSAELKTPYGDRLTDAYRYAGNLAAISPFDTLSVASGDMQVTRVGESFAQPLSIRARTKIDAGPQEEHLWGASNASVAVVSEIDELMAWNTGIDSSHEASLTDENGYAVFDLKPGNSVGVKRFVITGRSEYPGAMPLSAMATFIHVPNDAEIADSIPIVEYRFDEGELQRSRYLAASKAVVSWLDTAAEIPLVRSGQVWRAFTKANTALGLSPVCQFFGNFVAGAVTHFYTANPDECESLRLASEQNTENTPKMKYEGVVFYAPVPDASGHCPSKFPIPIVRYFSPVPAPHHYYQVMRVDVNENKPPYAEAINEGTVFCTDVGVGW